VTSSQAGQAVRNLTAGLPVAFSTAEFTW
jgi:hypothetical protein